MSKNILFSIFVLVLAALNIGTIRRNEDPIRDTQTSPIGYQQKMEEDKDGKKGALLYSVKYNPSDKFLTASPVGQEEEKATEEKAEEIAPAGLDWWEEIPVSEATSEEKVELEQEGTMPVQDETSLMEGAETSAPDPESGQWW